MADPKVSVYDPATGETAESALESYIVLTNTARGWEVTAEQRYANGTVQLTIKRVEQGGES